MADILPQLLAMSTAPKEPAVFAAWLKLDDAVRFLEGNVQDEDFVVYAGSPHCFMHAVLVPSALVAKPDINDLMSWSFNAVRHGACLGSAPRRGH
jgi:hypothetical protein